MQQGNGNSIIFDVLVNIDMMNYSLSWNRSIWLFATWGWAEWWGGVPWVTIGVSTLQGIGSDLNLLSSSCVARILPLLNCTPWHWYCRIPKQRHCRFLAVYILSLKVCCGNIIEIKSFLCWYSWSFILCHCFWFVYFLFTGMLTITDFIRILHQYYKQPGVSSSSLSFQRL